MLALGQCLGEAREMIILAHCRIWLEVEEHHCVGDVKRSEPSATFEDIAQLLCVMDTEKASPSAFPSKYHMPGILEQKLAKLPVEFQANEEILQKHFVH